MQLRISQTLSSWVWISLVLSTALALPVRAQSTSFSITRNPFGIGSLTYRFELIGLGVEEDARNGVLFPEKLGGRYVRLDRPNRLRLAGGATSGDAIRLSTSDDLISWEAAGPVMRGRPHYWE